MSSTDDPTSRQHSANEEAAGRSGFRTLRDGALIVSVFCLAIAAVMGSALASAPRSPLARWETALWVWAAVLLVAVAKWRDWIDEWFRSHRIAGFIATALTCGLATWFALAPNLEARFGVIDDHVILTQLGPGHTRLHWRQWPERIRASEAFSFGTMGRYRPAYAALLLTECCWWGREVRHWYVAHITLCATAVIFLTRASSRILGFTLAIAGSLALFGTTSIADTYCRLGPAEAYAMAALAVGIWALAKACRGDGPWCWWMTLAGFGLASMCKENFIPLAGLACAVGAFAVPRQKREHRAPAWIAIGLLAAHTLFMLVIVARMLLSMGRDIYAGPVGIESMVTPVAVSALTLLFGSALTALWPLLGWSWWSMRRSPAGAGALFSRSAAAFVVTALAAWFSQAAFYRDSGWPQGGHYDLPGIVVPIALLVFGAWYLLRATGFDTTGRAVMSALFVGLTFAGGSGSVNHVRADAVANATVTRHYWSWADKLARAALADPKRVIVLFPERPLNHYEMVSSVSELLRYKKVVNPIFYSTRFLGRPVGNALEESLFQFMKRGEDSQDPPLLKNDAAAGPDALFVAFGADSEAALAAEHANLHAKSLDDVLRPPPR